MKYIVQPVFKGSANTPGLTPGKTYTVAALHSGKVMSIRNGAIQVEQQTWDEDTNQQWQIEALSGADNGFFRIKSVKSGKYLDVSGNSKDKGAKIIEWQWHGGHNQQWKLNILNDGIYSIVSRSSGLNLDVSGNSQNQGAEVIQWSWHGGDNQRWKLSTITAMSQVYAFDPRVKIYQHNNYGGSVQDLGIGSYNMGDIRIGNDVLSSLRIPAGVRVTLYQHANFKGRTRVLTDDTPSLGDFNDQTSSIVIEPVVTIYQHYNYGGKKQHLGVGQHNMNTLTLGNDQMSSLKVPYGMVAYLYQHANYKGRMWAYTENEDALKKFNDQVSSIIVKMAGITVPKSALKFGYKICLRGFNGMYLTANPNGQLHANVPHRRGWEEFQIVRAGDSTMNNYLSYGDKVALKTAHGQYLTATPDGQLNCNVKHVKGWEMFTVVRSGPTLHNNFVSLGDTIALKSAHGLYIAVEPNGLALANRPNLGGWERLQIHTLTETSGVVNSSDDVGLSACGAEACGHNLCGAEACGLDVCGAAYCGADAVLIGACGAAASAIAICAADVAGVGACGAAACAAAAGGASVCGADACGAAACGAAACGAAGCGAAACGADICGVAACTADAGFVGACPVQLCGGDACAAAACAAEACGADACGAEACGADACGAEACAAEATGAEACGGDSCAIEACGAEACAAEATLIEACPADACAANVCAINACPADACAADACAIDVVPIIPGI